VGNDETLLNPNVEKRFRNLERMCFSPQYYAIVSLFLCGAALILNGIQIVLTTGTYNPMTDLATPVVIIFTLALCWVLRWSSFKVAKLFKLWEVGHQQSTGLGTNTKDAEVGLSSRLDLIVNDKNVMIKAADGGALIIPTIHPGKIEQTDAFMSREQRLKEVREKLQLEKFTRVEFKKFFVYKNQHWLKGNLSEVFTPRTSKLYRPQIIGKLLKLNGGSMKQDMFKEDRDLIVKMEGHDPKQVLKDETRKRMGAHTKEMLLMWHARAARIQKVREAVAGLIELQTQGKCFFCGKDWGLRAELIENIDDLFEKFLDDVKPDMTRWQGPWQEYFEKHAHLRTLCFRCQDELLEAHIRANREMMREYEEKMAFERHQWKLAEPQVTFTSVVRKYKA
jgi:hypothetical protein